MRGKQGTSYDDAHSCSPRAHARSWSNPHTRTLMHFVSSDATGPEVRLHHCERPCGSLCTLLPSPRRGFPQEEVEIRAATVVATDMICAALNAVPAEHRERPFAAVEVDWLLWQEGERRNALGDIPPHHRTLTCFY